MRLAAFSVCLFVATAHAEDWPQWRGPDRNGLVAASPPLAATWPANGPKKLWESESIPMGRSHGWASPVVAAGRVYLQAPQKTGDQWRDVFYCLDAATGRTVWKRAQAESGSLREGSSSTVCVAGDLVYGAGSKSVLYCLKAADGAVVWQVDAGKYWGSVRDDKRTGTHSSFLVADGVAVIQGAHHDGNTKGAVVALDAKTGAEIWSRPKHGGQGSPVLWRKDGEAYVLTVARDGLSAFRLRDGRALWTILPGGSSHTPVVHGDYAVFLSDGWPQRGLVCFRMGVEKAEKVWQLAGRYDAGSSAVVYKGHVYATASNRGEHVSYSHSVALCVELETGTVKWEAKTPCGGYKCPVVADGKLVYTAAGQVVMARADPSGHQELARLKAEADEYASPALADGRLFFRTSPGSWMKGGPSKVVCYDLREQPRP